MHASAENERPNGADGVESEGFGPAVEVEALQARVAELEAQLMRDRAESENQRKRWLREFEQARKFANDRILGDLLPVIDSLEQGIKATEVAGAGVDSFRTGADMTLRLLRKAVESQGLVTVDPQGHAFNPEQHQAVGMQPSAEVPADHVLGVLQKGYLLNDRLLRPAMVVVSQGA
jgi:molecular chaperone GrpE